MCKFCESDFGVIIWSEMVANDWDISVIMKIARRVHRMHISRCKVFPNIFGHFKKICIFMHYGFENKFLALKPA